MGKGAKGKRGGGERGRGREREGEEREPLLLIVVISGLLSRYGKHSSDLVFSGLSSIS